MTDISARVRAQAAPDTIAYEMDLQYCSREAPIVISAGNTLFRVHAWNMVVYWSVALIPRPVDHAVVVGGNETSPIIVLMASGYFRVLAVHFNGKLESVEPIPSDVSPAALRDFLEIIHNAQHSQWSIPLPPFDPDPSPIIECRSLARRWDCSLVGGIAQRALSARIQSDAWYMFKIASQLEDEQLGRECVAGFTLHDTPVEIYLWGSRIDSELFGCANRVRPGWIEGLTYEGLSDAFLIELYSVVPIGTGEAKTFILSSVQTDDERS